LWTIEKPEVGALDTFDVCRAGITNVGLRGRLLAARPLISAAEAAFDAAAVARTDHLIATATHLGAVTSAEMER